MSKKKSKNKNPVRKGVTEITYVADNGKKWDYMLSIEGSFLYPCEEIKYDRTADSRTDADSI